MKKWSARRSAGHHDVRPCRRRHRLGSNLLRKIRGGIAIGIEGKDAVEFADALQGTRLNAALISASADQGGSSVLACEVFRCDRRRRAGAQDCDLDRIHHREHAPIDGVAEHDHALDSGHGVEEVAVHLCSEAIAGDRCFDVKCAAVCMHTGDGSPGNLATA